ncbi:ETS-related transcription factor Elf-4-like [Orbicella faveolata]|uniref:ETS-related transcription factor Elf-4-like n=1 Tax=Orbicella faveolata TaxID=48498 RepID=UPI0009E45638|nr:ETS-related transcription factor Elf-4-like [Orbicella faveolata]
MESLIGLCPNDLILVNTVLKCTEYLRLYTRCILNIKMSEAFGDRANVQRKSEPQHKDIVHLWEFLFELLADESCGSIITWTTEENREFKLKNPEQVAKLWGAYKGVKAMNYEKLSRALRTYYSKGIIVKISGQRLTYRFAKLPYKYEPGVTRSRRHGHRIKACIQQHMPQPSSSSCQINPGSLSSSISSVSTRLRKSCSWPLVPMPSHSISWNPGSTPLISDCSESRIMFPPFAADPMTLSSSSLSSLVSFVLNDPIECLGPLVQDMRTSKPKSIAVPVIKWNIRRS